MISNEKLKFWIDNKLNVLFIGKHGIGKSSMIIDAFNKAGVKWLYFSAATMDPWVDFIGVPKEKKAENGSSYLDLIRPKVFEDDTVEALFFDEYNRSSKKVRNAVMELIQFKSINGKKFNNLKIVWAAINPDEDSEKELKYDVEKADPAQLDRFQVHVEIPYKPDYSYFKSKYGIEPASASIEWWNGLSNELKNKISPRRLDYAIEVYNKNGDIRDVIPKQANIDKLIHGLANGPIKDKLKGLLEDKDENIKSFFAVENNYAAAIDLVLKDNKYLNKFLINFPKEKISSLIHKNSKVQGVVTSDPKYVPILEEIVAANTNQVVCNKINKYLKQLNPVVSIPNNNAGKSLTYNKNCSLSNSQKTDISLLTSYLSSANPNSFSYGGKIRSPNAKLSLLTNIEFCISPLDITDKKLILKIITALNQISNASHYSTLKRFSNVLVKIYNTAIWNYTQNYINGVVGYNNPEKEFGNPILNHKLASILFNDRDCIYKY